MNLEFPLPMAQHFVIIFLLPKGSQSNRHCTAEGAALPQKG